MPTDLVAWQVAEVVGLVQDVREYTMQLSSSGERGSPVMTELTIFQGKAPHQKFLYKNVILGIPWQTSG